MKAESETDPGREWMLEFQRGDESAFDRIVRYYQGGVRKFVGRYLSDADRAEDLSQEAFVRVYRARDRYEPTAKFQTWLLTIVSRLCLNEIRSLKRQRKAVMLQQPGPSFHDGSGDRVDPVAAVADTRNESPGEALERAELEEVLDGTIRSLPENQRIAILLLKFQDASYQEIADVLGVSVKAVKSLVNRARSTLRRRLQRYDAGIGGVESSRRAGISNGEA